MASLGRLTREFQVRRIQVETGHIKSMLSKRHRMAAGAAAQIEHSCTRLELECLLNENGLPFRSLRGE